MATHVKLPPLPSLQDSRFMPQVELPEALQMPMGQQQQLLVQQPGVLQRQVPLIMSRQQALLGGQFQAEPLSRPIPPVMGVKDGKFAPQLREGCQARLRSGEAGGRRFFLNMGGHDGSSIPEFIGDGIDRYEVWAWEPNPKHETAWRKLETKHNTVCYIGKAVWITESELSLYVDQSKEAQKGTGIVRKEYGGMHSDKHTVTVLTEDIHDWMMRNTRPEDEIVVKMDIEGAEYPVLQRMLVNGSACRIKKLFIEFHSKMDNLSSKGQKKQNNRDATPHQLIIMEMLNACQRPVEVEIVA